MPQRVRIQKRTLADTTYPQLIELGCGNKLIVHVCKIPASACREIIHSHSQWFDGSKSGKLFDDFRNFLSVHS